MCVCTAPLTLAAISPHLLETTPYSTPHRNHNSARSNHFLRSKLLNRCQLWLRLTSKLYQHVKNQGAQNTLLGSSMMHHEHQIWG